MKIINFTLVIIAISFLTSCDNPSNNIKIENIEHKIFAKVFPETGEINVSDSLTIPIEFWNKLKDHSFTLNKGLVIKNIEKLNIENKGLSSDSLDNLYYVKSINKINGNPILILSYNGKFYGKFEDQIAEYARGFSETNGIVSDTGVYLSSSSSWLPQFDLNCLIKYQLKVEINKDWKVLSAGDLISKTENNDKIIYNFESNNPIDDVFLIANKWTEFEITSNNVKLQALLLSPDSTLANKYLQATSNYLNLYEKLIGNYPYSKFALVENFWETGYGMPSFTLLGSQVIRFPWILYSSYPHELLHNYWGNGVFVNDTLGNWCEGITAYMADHLMKEEQNQGKEYRQATLEKFTNYVNDGNDFPIKEFVNRNNSAQEAVGYGKVLMLNNMLRVNVGDSLFLAAYRKLYNDFKFKRASFYDIQKCFENVSGKDFSKFFTQWINRTGAPKIELENVKCELKNNKYKLSFDLKQIQKEDEFDLNIPVYVLFNNDTNYFRDLVFMDTKAKSYSFEFEKRPVELLIDPQFNVMRRLDKSEIPATLSQLFGQKEAVIILPSKSKNLKSYEMLANLWTQNQKAQGFNLEILYDNKIKELPTDKGVWIIGAENKFNNIKEFNENYKNIVDVEQVKSFAEKGGVVYIMPNKNYLPIGFLSADNSDLIISLSHRLLHYGKYSLLGFEPTKGSNTLKEILPIKDSPLSKKIEYSDSNIIVIAKIKPRKALSDLVK